MHHNEPAPLFDAEYPALYISSSLGIWRITANGDSTKLSADEFEGNRPYRNFAILRRILQVRV